jgi:hypothetical protein
MKKALLFITLFLIALLSTKVNAQLVVKINDKVITEGQLINADIIKKIEVSIAKPVVLKPNSKGKARLYVELLGTDDKVVEGYTYEKEGINNIDNLLKNTKNTYVLYQEGGENKTFIFTLNAPPTLKAVLQEASTNPINKLIKAKVSLMFSDSTIDAFGVVHYSYPYDLVPVFQFNINNANANGSISLLEVGSTFSSDIATQLKYKKQEKYKSLFYSDVDNPLFTNSDVIKCYLEGYGSGYMDINFNTIDVKNKTQDEYINDLKVSLETFLLTISNVCNASIKKKLPTVKNSDWEKVVSSDIIIPFLDGKNNKSYLTEVIMKPTELGQFSGFKFNSISISSQCDYSFNDRKIWGFVNVYFLKHPKNDKQVLMVFSYYEDSKITKETAKDSEDRINLLLSSQKF